MTKRRTIPGTAPVLGWPDVREAPVHVYALVDPRNGLMRYIGKSQSPMVRVSSHCSRAAAQDVWRWTKELCHAGVRPAVVVLYTVPPGDDADAAERFFIAFYGGAGAPLLNMRVDDSAETASAVRDTLRRLARESAPTWLSPSARRAGERRRRHEAARWVEVAGKALGLKSRAGEKIAAAIRRTGTFNAWHLIASYRATWKKCRRGTCEHECPPGPYRAARKFLLFARSVCRELDRLPQAEGGLR